MSAIDELRSYAHQRLFDGSEKYDQHLLYLADQIEEEMANYIELPKDADGVTIHLGDMLEIEHGHGVLDSGEVTDIHLQVGKCVVSIGFGDEEGVTAYPEDYRHVTPDSWERIISEFAERVLRSGHQWGLDAPAATAEFVERCKRLAGEVE